MIKKHETPWSQGSVFICTKCGAKFNNPEMAEEIKSELKKEMRVNEGNSKIRIMTSGCLGVCYPERQTFSFQPINGLVEVFTTELEKSAALTEIRECVQKKNERKRFNLKFFILMFRKWD